MQTIQYTITRLVIILKAEIFSGFLLLPAKKVTGGETYSGYCFAGGGGIMVTMSCFCD